MAIASLPVWMEFVLNGKYPLWRQVEYNEDGSARYMPAGVRLVEKSLLRVYNDADVAACFPDVGRPMTTKTRKELIAYLKPHYWQYLRPDNGDLPEGYVQPERANRAAHALKVIS